MAARNCAAAVSTQGLLVAAETRLRREVPGKAVVVAVVVVAVAVAVVAVVVVVVDSVAAVALASRRLPPKILVVASTDV